MTISACEQGRMDGSAPSVMAGLVPAIHCRAVRSDRLARDASNPGLRSLSMPVDRVGTLVGVDASGQARA